MATPRLHVPAPLAEGLNLDLPEAYELMRTFIQRHPEIWDEDIAV